MCAADEDSPEEGGGAGGFGAPRILWQAGVVASDFKQVYVIIIGRSKVVAVCYWRAKYTYLQVLGVEEGLVDCGR